MGERPPRFHPQPRWQPHRASAYKPAHCRLTLYVPSRPCLARRYERPLEVGDRGEIGGQPGIVRTIEPLLGEREIRLVVQLLLDRG